MTRALHVLTLALGLLPACAEAQERGRTGARTDLPLDSIRLPEGFSISVYAADVPNARSLALSPNGVLYVGSRAGDRVRALVDADGDQVADRVHVIDTGLRMPNGVAWRDGSLYVAEVSRILRYDGIDDRLEDPPDPVVIRDDYPTDRRHGWKFIRFDPTEEWLYVPVGAPCNVCLPEAPHGTITRIRPDGSERQIVVEGVRNSVGFDWNPATGVLWFTDNGRDRMGDDVPPDELNRVPAPGGHYGYPFCHGGDIPDPEYGDRRSCSEFVPPALRLGPHVAALGFRFYDGEMFPEEYRGDILLAEHGSWNRSRKIGYRVMRVGIENGEAVSYEPFAEGWLRGQDDWGRPVDVLVMPDGALLVSDDENGVIYRIAYGEG